MKLNDYAKVDFDRLTGMEYKPSLQLVLTEITNNLSTLLEKDPEDEMNQCLNHYQGVLRRCRKVSPEEKDCTYEIGRLAGILEAFGRLYENRMEEKRLDAEIEHNLNSSRGATERILQALYENRGREEELTHEELAKAAGTTKQSLTNIMKRLEPSLVVRSKLTGTRKYYCLTDAGVRYYEKKNRKENGYSAELSDMLSKLESRMKDTEGYLKKIAELTAENKVLKKSLKEEKLAHQTCEQERQELWVANEKASYDLKQQKEENRRLLLRVREKEAKQLLYTVDTDNDNRFGVIDRDIKGRVFAGK